MLDFPLTKFLARLLAMTDQELAEADPFRAARTFKIRLDWADAYIAEQQLLRGVEPAKGPLHKRAPGPFADLFDGEDGP